MGRKSLIISGMLLAFLAIRNPAEQAIAHISNEISEITREKAAIFLEEKIESAVGNLDFMDVSAPKFYHLAEHEGFYVKKTPKRHLVFYQIYDDYSQVGYSANSIIFEKRMLGEVWRVTYIDPIRNPEFYSEDENQRQIFDQHLENIAQQALEHASINLEGYAIELKFKEK